MSSEPRLPFDDPPSPLEAMIARDAASRTYAVDPSKNVVLEASAGTGKTHVLVTRYVNLLRAGVDPSHILAITFTRKAAAEMRERIVKGLRELAETSDADAARWRTLRDRLGDIAISTIDAFCFALLREFPLEADLDPGFDVADETMVPRLVEEALDGTLRVGRRLAASDEDVALLMASLGERQVRSGLGALLDRRLSAGRTLRRFLAAAQAPPPADALARFAARVRGVLSSIDGGIDGFVGDGPVADESYDLLAADLRLAAGDLPIAAAEDGSFPVRALLERVAKHFLKDDGEPRVRAPFTKKQYASPAAHTRHARALASASPHIAAAKADFEREINGALARATSRLFRVARWRYGRALDEQSSIDFPEGLSRALRLLRRMDEFAQSRYRLEARYHHVLVDEFQDTNASQWRLVARLIESWGEGIGLAHDGPLQPSIFIVGDRKQSIYAFRDADVRILRRAGRHIAALRPDGRVRRSIARSYRSAPELLAFTNDLFSSMDMSVARADAFKYAERDRFPVEAPPRGGDRLGLVVADTATAAAEAMADEIARLLASATVHDRQAKTLRAVRPGDVAILFRSRATHREIEAALEARGIPTYVYKGLGFFDADEVKDLVVLLRFLANPASPLRVAAFLRSRFVRLSDPAVRLLGPSLAAIVSGRAAAPGDLPPEDRRVFDRLRASLGRWLPLVDRVPPAELLDRVLDESAYAFELHGPRLVQARENLKKIRAMTRRLQNRGYQTMARIADHLDRLSAGDESNATVDALDAVNLMTVHAAKGLEFPVVFVAHLARGTGGRGEAIVLVPAGPGGRPLVSVAGHLPEAEASVRERDLEETKRLLYVAVTRARDRLYLSAVLRQGKFPKAAGSLGEVLPASIAEAVAEAATGVESVEWRAENGGVHAIRVVPPASGDRSPAVEATGAAADGAPPPADFARLEDAGATRRVAASGSAIASGDGGGPEPAIADDGSRRQNLAAADAALVGTLVHRLFQVSGGRPDADPAWLEREARRFVREDADGDCDDGDRVVAEAVRSFLDLRSRPDLAALLAGATCHFELPFSARLAANAAEIVRGSIDCLAIGPGDRATVIEIKTGRPLSWHQAQLDTYVRAARALFPHLVVEGRLIYQ